MKKLSLFCLAIICMIGCSQSDLLPTQKVPLNELTIQTRSSQNQLVLWDDIGPGAVNAASGEYEITITGDFQVRPYGDSTWVSYSNKKIKVKCKCWDTCSDGYCDRIVTNVEPIEIECDNHCTGTQECGCTMRTRGTSLYDDNTVFTLDEGGDIRRVP